MKLTRHLQDRIQRDRPYTRLDWIAQVIENPIEREIQPDGRIRFWGEAPYPDLDNPHILRVVTLEDGETVLTAFFDSGFTRRRL